jgi:hypothetical protein
VRLVVEQPAIAALALGIKRLAVSLGLAYRCRDHIPTLVLPRQRTTPRERCAPVNLSARRVRDQEGVGLRPLVSVWIVSATTGSMPRSPVTLLLACQASPCSVASTAISMRSGSLARSSRLAWSVLDEFDRSCECAVAGLAQRWVCSGPLEAVNVRSSGADWRLANRT